MTDPRRDACSCSPQLSKPPAVAASSTVTTNPHYNPSSINARDYVYCSGVRNPFGGAWREADGSRYMVENNEVGHSEDRSKPFYSNDGLEAAQNGNVFGYNQGLVHVLGYWSVRFLPGMHQGLLSATLTAVDAAELR